MPEEYISCKVFFALQRSLYYILHKPYGYLSQFTDEGKWKGLNQLISVENDVYCVGRLDAESEGLLLLTNDKSINNRLLNPKNKHKRTYLVQVDGVITSEAIENLKTSVNIKIGKQRYDTLPAEAQLIDKRPDYITDREPPVRFRKSIPTSWVELKIVEGKNRQVRKMTAAVGFPTLRLIRMAVENLSITDINRGEIISISKAEFLKKLNL